MTRWAVNVLPTLPFFSFGNVAILGDAVSSVLWYPNRSEHDRNLIAGSCHGAVSGSRRRTGYRGQSSHIQFGLKEIEIGPI